MVALRKDGQPKGKTGPKPKGRDSRWVKLRVSPEAAEWLEAVSAGRELSQSELLWEGVRQLAKSGQLGKGVKVPERV